MYNVNLHLHTYTAHNLNVQRTFGHSLVYNIWSAVSNAFLKSINANIYIVSFLFIHEWCKTPSCLQDLFQPVEEPT